jgi:hypothetical protein
VHRLPSVRSSATTSRVNQFSSLCNSSFDLHLQSLLSIRDLRARVAGYTGELAVASGGKLVATTPIRAHRHQLRGVNDARESLKRILVSHGEPIENNPRQALRELAESLN